MIYPEFLKKNDVIGICAPSAGIGRKLDEHLKSIKNISDHGFKYKETKSVRVDNIRSTSATKRALELDQLVCDKSVKLVAAAAGGEYMYEILPHINYENIIKNPKWYTGMSDPTNMLYIITTMCDIATLYGQNASRLEVVNRPTEDFFKIISGNIIKQKSYKKYLTYKDYHDYVYNYHDVKWVAKKDMCIQGRLIGGCFEVIEKIIGTQFDYTINFTEDYKDDGIVFFFDIYSKNPNDVYLTLLQMKYAGWFKYCKGVLFSRVAFPQEGLMTYKQAIGKALGKIPYIMDMDFGHTDAGMTLINGALVKVNYKDGKGDVSFKLK